MSVNIIRKLKSLKIGLLNRTRSCRKQMARIFSIATFSYPQFIYDTNTYTQYAVDILITLFEDEKKTQLDSSCTQINLREIIVETIFNYAKHHNFSIATVHLAVFFMDIHMNRYILSELPEHVKLTSIVSCLLAAKSNECDSDIPSIKDLVNNGHVNLQNELGIDFRKKNDYTAQQLKMAYTQFSKIYAYLEFILFESLEFSLTRPTVISFLDIFQKICVTEKDLNDIDESIECKYESLGCLRTHAFEYLEVLSMVVLYHPEFYRYLPSKVAAAIIATSRRLLGIKTIWSIELEFFTRANLEDIEPIILLFNELHSFMIENAEKFRNFTNQYHYEDSGFHSDTQASSGCNSIQSNEQVDDN